MSVQEKGMKINGFASQDLRLIFPKIARQTRGGVAPSAARHRSQKHCSMRTGAQPYRATFSIDEARTSLEMNLVL